MKFLVTLLLFSQLSLAAEINISVEARECIEGRLSMSAEINVDSEIFYFQIPCRHSFDERFHSTQGLECRALSWACRHSTRTRTLFVNCEDGSEGQIDYFCPRD